MAAIKCPTTCCRRSYILEGAIPVQLCLIELPKDYPPGNDRGKTYSAKNIRTGAT